MSVVNFRNKCFGCDHYEGWIGDHKGSNTRVNCGIEVNSSIGSGCGRFKPDIVATCRNSGLNCINMAWEEYNGDYKYNCKIGREFDTKYCPDFCLKDSSGDVSTKEGCFIATAVYGDYNAPQVIELRSFRDRNLSVTYLGRLFVRAYYYTSPKILDLFGKNFIFLYIFRKILDLFLIVVKFFKI